LSATATPSLQRFGGPALFVLLWSTGFVGAKYGLPYAEPFTFLGARLVAAAGLLAVLALAIRSAAPRSRAQYGHAAVVGLLLHGGYLGGVFYAVWVGVPAGVTAVIVSLQPVLTALLAARMLGERPSTRQWLGLMLGVAGVALVVGPGIAAAGSAEPLSAAGLTACLVALGSGTLGTVYQKRHGDGIPLVWGTAVQYVAAAAVLLVVAAATEQMTIRWTGEFRRGLRVARRRPVAGGRPAAPPAVATRYRGRRLQPLLPRPPGRGRRGLPALRRARHRLLVGRHRRHRTRRRPRGRAEARPVAAGSRTRREASRHLTSPSGAG
jgi:drug/metabolite transporter (DMT)-like permease